MRRHGRRARARTSTGSAPPIVRCPVSRHQPDLDHRERSLDLVVRSRSACRREDAAAKRQPVLAGQSLLGPRAGGGPGAPAARRPAPVACSTPSPARPPIDEHPAAGLRDQTRGPASLGGRARVEVGLVQHAAATNPPTRSQPVAPQQLARIARRVVREEPGRAELGPAPDPAPPSPPAPDRRRASRPTPGSRMPPTRSGAPASRSSSVALRAGRARLRVLHALELLSLPGD